jgi:hypothetical protein
VAEEDQAGAEEDQAGSQEPSPVWDVSGEIEIAEGTSLTAPPIPPEVSNPLEQDEPEGTIPPSPLWAMKDRRHFFGARGHGDAERIRAAQGLGDSTVYFIDDGRKHCMAGRRVGSSPDGNVYSLVGRVKLDLYEKIASGEATTTDVFSDAHDICLCGVYEEEGMASDVIVIQHYPHFADVPTAYLPPSPFIEFEDDLPENG